MRKEVVGCWDFSYPMVLDVAGWEIMAVYGDKST